MPDQGPKSSASGPAEQKSPVRPCAPCGEPVLGFPNPNSLDSPKTNTWNFLFCNILLITHCESRFCGRNRHVAGGKHFRSRTLGGEIPKKNHIGRIRPTLQAWPNDPRGEKAVPQPLASFLAGCVWRQTRRRAPRFDTTERLT